MTSWGEVLYPILSFMSLYGRKSHNPSRLRQDQNFRYNLYLLATLEGSGGLVLWQSQEHLRDSPHKVRTCRKGIHFCHSAVHWLLGDAFRDLRDWSWFFAFSLVVGLLYLQPSRQTSSRSSRSGSIVPLLSGIANQHLSICTAKCTNRRSRRLTTLHSDILFFEAQHVFLYLFCNNYMVFLCFINERSLL